MALGAAAPVSVAFASWAARPDRPGGRRMLAAGYALALGSVAVVMTATDAFTALFGWEALTVAFYLLAGANARDRDRAGAARITVAFGKVSGAALLIGLLLLADAVALDRPGLVRARAWRRGQDDGAGAAARPGSRSRRGWCRSRCGCRAGTRRRQARPAR